MLVWKYLHSCILVEENGNRLLIDPGSFSFVENKLKPEDIGAVDIILITHKHPDHCYPEALKYFSSLYKMKIIASEEVCAFLRQEGLECEVIHPGETKTLGGFKIQTFEAQHGPIPSEIPHNMAFLINDKLLHPGDSLSVPGISKCEVLALPVAGPWLKAVDAIEFAARLTPKKVIPIHDAMIKDFMLDRMYSIMFQPSLLKKGIEFHPLALNENLQI